MCKIIELCAVDTTMNVLLKKLNIQLIEEGYDLIGVCSYGKFTDDLKKEGFNIINVQIDRSIKPISNLNTIYNLYKVFKKIRPDIVHVHTPVAAVLGRIAAKMARVPIIVYTAHGFYFHENMTPITYKLFLNIEKFMAKYFTNFIFTQSDEDRITALKNNFIEESRILTIGNGIDVWGKFNPDNIDEKEILELYKEFSITDEDIIITFVGRLVKEKGILDLLQAFQKIDRNNIKLLVVGDVVQGSRDIKTKDLIERYKKNKNIIFAGYRGDINNILHITDIFCLPSYREGMPRSIIEAMAMESAVIATNIRGSREEVVDGQTGFLVPLGSPKDIADRIQTLTKDKDLLERMKKNGRKRAEVYFNEQDVVEKQLKVFKQLLSERGQI